MWLPSLIQQHYSLLLGHRGSLRGGSCPLSNLPPFPSVVNHTVSGGHLGSVCRELLLRASLEEHLRRAKGSPSTVPHPIRLLGVLRGKSTQMGPGI